MPSPTGSRSAVAATWTQPGNRESPGDALVRLPIDDLLEGRQPAGHALRGRSHASAPAGWWLLDDQRTFPPVPESRRGQVGPDDGRLGRQVRPDIEDHVRVGDVEPTEPGLGLPASLEIPGECGDPTEVLDRLLARAETQAARFETEGGDRGSREQGVAVPARFGGRRPLQQAMDEDDVRPGQLIATGDAAANEGPVMHEQLEVEFGSQPTRVAVAAGGLVDAAQAAPEGDVGRLDRVEEERPVGSPVLDEEEGGIALELRQPEGRIEAADDRLEEVAGDGRRVLDLAAER